MADVVLTYSATQFWGPVCASICSGVRQNHEVVCDASTGRVIEYTARVAHLDKDKTPDKIALGTFNEDKLVYFESRTGKLPTERIAFHLDYKTSFGLITLDEAKNVIRAYESYTQGRPEFVTQPRTHKISSTFHPL